MTKGKVYVRSAGYWGRGWKRMEERERRKERRGHIHTVGHMKIRRR